MPPRAPLGDSRVPVSAPRSRVLSAVATLGVDGHPVTLSEVAQLLGGHPNTSRQHLDALAAAGLLDVTDVARPTSGRRPHGYTVTDTGRRALSPSDNGGYREIVEAVAAHHVANGRPASEAAEIGELWGERTAPPVLGDAVEAITDMLDMLGFDPAPAPDGDGFVLRSCPLLGIATESPEFACTMHEGMLRRVLRRVGGGQRVRLLPFYDVHGCRLSFRDDDASADPDPDA